MIILNRRQFMQLLAGTAIAVTVPLPPLPEVSAPAVTSPSLAFKAMGEQFATGFVEGLNGLTVTDIVTEAGATRYDFSSEHLREIPDWSSQIFTVRGARGIGDTQRQEEYRFWVEPADVPHGGWDEVLEFVEGKLTQENLVWVDKIF